MDSVNNGPEPGIFEIIHSTRSMRRLKPDPVPDDLIEEILRAGQAAPSGGNNQSWAFIVVKDPGVKQQVQGFYRKAWDGSLGPYYARQLEAMEPGPACDKYQRQVDATFYLTEHLHEAPVWIVACHSTPGGRINYATGPSIYPAVQNVLLAIRALGLGSTLTVRHMEFHDDVDAVFGLPEDVRSFAILPIGYPMGRFGPVGRKPLDDIVYRDRWGEPYFKK